MLSWRTGILRWLLVRLETATSNVIKHLCRGKIILRNTVVLSGRIRHPIRWPFHIVEYVKIEMRSSYVVR
jgi:hypothetical protein